jgi:hypothetical protein
MAIINKAFPLFGGLVLFPRLGCGCGGKRTKTGNFFPLKHLALPHKISGAMGATGL